MPKLTKLQKQFNRMFDLAEKWRDLAKRDGVKGDDSKEYKSDGYLVRVYLSRDTMKDLMPGYCSIDLRVSNSDEIISINPQLKIRKIEFASILTHDMSKLEFYINKLEEIYNNNNNNNNKSGDLKC